MADALSCTGVNAIVKKVYSCYDIVMGCPVLLRMAENNCLTCTFLRLNILTLYYPYPSFIARATKKVHLIETHHIRLKIPIMNGFLWKNVSWHT